MKKLIIFYLVSFSFMSFAHERVISTVPSLTETIFKLGQGKKLVAISQFCKTPNDWPILPKIGTGLRIQLEEVVKLRPDLVIMGDYASDKGILNLKKLNIKVVKIPHNRIEDIQNSFALLGKYLNASYKKQREKFNKSLVKTNKLRGKNVLAVISASMKDSKVRNLIVATENSFYGDLIKFAGGKNFTIKTKKGFAPLNNEALINFSPDIIFDIGAKDKVFDFKKRKKDWSKILKTLGLIKTKIQIIREDYAVIPGPNIGLLYKEFISAR